MLRAGIIGLGVGEAHIAGYESHPDCEVVALCDFDPARLDQVRERFPRKRITRDPTAILDDPDIDVVSIASYDQFHHEQVVRAISRQKHVFVEKPLCQFREQARDIRQRLRENPRVRLSSNLILRRSPRFQQLKAWVDAGQLGELYYLEGDYNYGRLQKLTDGWRGAVEDYSVVCGGGVHLLDLMLWLTAQSIVEVTAYGTAIASRGSGFRYADMVTAILRFERGAVGKIAVNMGCVHPHFHPFAVYGTNGTFINGMPHGLRYQSRDPTHPAEVVDAPYPGVPKGGLLPGFVRTILDDAPSEVHEDDVFRAMGVCFAIDDSLRWGGPVPVESI